MKHSLCWTTQHATMLSMCTIATVHQKTIPLSLIHTDPVHWVTPTVAIKAWKKSIRTIISMVSIYLKQESSNNKPSVLFLVLPFSTVRDKVIHLMLWNTCPVRCTPEAMTFGPISTVKLILT